MNNILWYNKQSQEWMEGLPIGNGRLAAMVWGDESTDVISLNHEWLWRGINRNRDNLQVSSNISQIRSLLKEGDFFRATSLANTFLGGHGGVSKIKNKVDAYQPAGDLSFTIDDASFIRRQLNMEEAVINVQRSINGSSIMSHFIAHPVHNLIICRWDSASTHFSGEISFKRTDDPDVTERLQVAQSSLVYECSFKAGIQYKVLINIKSDGDINYTSTSMYVTNATNVTAYINIATSVKCIDEEINSYPVPSGLWEDILASHKKAFSKIYNRLNLDIELPLETKPVNELVDDAKKGVENPVLLLKYFNYGRYLLISSSICGELPANLQGKWNDKICPPWECDYHFDINLQMNYWPAEAANLSDCTEALFQYIERFIPHGRKAAKDLYGCNGVWLPLQTDAWGRSTPESYGWSVWIGAAPWIAQHFWWHYEYTGDLTFLKNRAYPFFKEIAIFYQDYLLQDEFGTYQIMPSQSPENRFEGTGFWPVSIGVSSSMDVQLAYDSLGYAIQSAKILSVDPEFVEKWAELRMKLPPFKIGFDGRLLEWDIERVEVEPGHRHLSHLYGLYPSNIFNPIDTQPQYDAAVKSLQYRLLHGGGHTGWSRAWVACLYARIGDANKTQEHLYGLIKDFATVTLLDLHPPRIFQIDGNLGAVAAVLESIAQYWGGKVHLLRALPDQWSAGKISGIKVPGGHELEISWKNAEITELSVILGYCGSILLADMAGKLHINDTGTKEGRDILIKGNIGDKITLYKL